MCTSIEPSGIQKLLAKNPLLQVQDSSKCTYEDSRWSGRKQSTDRLIFGVVCCGDTKIFQDTQNN